MYNFNRYTPVPAKPQKPPQKFNLKTFKQDTCKSLHDVEYFLNKFSNTFKYIRLINLLK